MESITIEKKQNKGFLRSIYKYASATKISHTPDFVKTPTTKDAKYSDYPVVKREIQEAELVADSGGRKTENRVKVRQDVASPKVMHSRMVAEVARKSVSHLETNLTSVASFLQVKVLVTDMPGFMQVHAFKCARRTYDSLEKFSARHMAYNIKKEFDKTYGPAWHCIVGSSFGSFVTHSTGCFLYFSIEKLYILVFRTKVQKSSD